MSVLTGICISLGCALAALAIAVLIEERNERRRQIQAARAEQARRWHELQAIAKLMQEQREDMFDRAAWYEVYEDRTGDKA
jgi:hypothetical protein